MENDETLSSSYSPLAMTVRYQVPSELGWEGSVFVEVQEERNIAIRIATKFTVILNFMGVILKRGLD